MFSICLFKTPMYNVKEDVILILSCNQLYIVQITGIKEIFALFVHVQIKSYVTRFDVEQAVRRIFLSE